MGHGRDESRLLRLAQELAETGRYRTIQEVEAALKLREPEARLPANKIARLVIDGTCFRVRREMGMDA